MAGQEDAPYLDAIRDYALAYKFWPSDVQTRNALIWCYRTQGEQLMDDHDYADAAYSFRQALVLDPDNRDARAELVSAYRIQGRSDRANAVERMEDRFTGSIP